MNPIISLVGNIGAGKTTLLKNLENNPSIIKRNMVVVYEPVHLWTQKPENGGDSILDLFYQDNIKYGFVFQMLTLQTRFQHLIDTARKHPGKVLICERCPVSDYKIFAQMLHDSKVINDQEMMVYTKWFDMMFDVLKPNICGIAYLNVPIATCASRIIKRDRKGEGSITMNYLHALHDVHERWLGVNATQSEAPKIPIYRLEIDDDKNVKMEEFASFVNKIIG